MMNENINNEENRIKVQQIKAKEPSKCSIFQVGNKLVEMCEDNKQCKLVNNILECPAYSAESNTMYGFIEDVGIDHTLNEDIYNMTNYVETPYLASETNVQISNSIRNSVNNRINTNFPSNEQQYLADNLSGMGINQESEIQTSIGSSINNQTNAVLQTSVDRNNINNSLNNNSETINKPAGIIKTINSYRSWIIIILVILCLILIGLIIYALSYYKAGSIETIPLVIESPSLLSQGPSVLNV